MKKIINNEKKELFGIAKVINLLESNYNTEYRKRGNSLTYEQKKQLSRNLFK